METKTDLLKDVDLQLSPSATVAEMQAALGDKLGWAPAESAVRCCPLLRLQKPSRKQAAYDAGTLGRVLTSWPFCMLGYLYCP